MATGIAPTDFIVWGADQTAYGPVELPALVTWIKDDRVTADTWVFTARDNVWQRAMEIPELRMFFSRAAKARAGASPDTSHSASIDPRALRRVKVLGGMSDEQLERFAQFVEIEKIPQWTVVVKQGEAGEAMYLILDGELRVRTTLRDKETILTTLGTGEFFGDISLFDQGPRSADVVANTDALLCRISARAFDKLAKEAPELATPFLRAMGRTLSARIRADNRRVARAEVIGQGN